MDIHQFQRDLIAVDKSKMPSIDEILDVVRYYSDEGLENFYINKILPYDKRSIREILGGSKGDFSRGALDISYRKGG